MRRLPGVVLSLWVIVSSPGRQAGDHVCVLAGCEVEERSCFEAQIGLQHICITDSCLKFSLEVFCLQKWTVFASPALCAGGDMKSRKCDIWKKKSRMQTWPLVTRLSLYVSFCFFFFFYYNTITFDPIDLMTFMTFHIESIHRPCGVSLSALHREIAGQCVKKRKRFQSLTLSKFQTGFNMEPWQHQRQLTWLMLTVISRLKCNIHNGKDLTNVHRNPAA